MFQYWLEFNISKRPVALYRITDEIGDHLIGQYLDRKEMDWRPAQHIVSFSMHVNMDTEIVTEDDAIDFVLNLESKLAREEALEILNRPGTAPPNPSEFHKKREDWRRAAALYYSAVELFESGNHQEAADRYREVLSLEPDDFEAMTNLAVILDKAGKAEEAEELYLKAASRPFFDGIAMFNLGYMHDRAGRLDLAETWYRRCLVAEPTHSPALVNLSGVVQRLRGDLQESKALLEAAITLDPTDSIALYELANIYRLQSQFFEAEILYRKAVREEPADPLANYNLAAFLTEIDQHEEAERLFETAYSLDHDSILKRGGK